MSGRFLQMSGVVVDLVHHVDHLPRPGEEVETPEVMIAAGGGFNAMQAARRFGIDVRYGGSLGMGLFSDIANQALQAAGISILQSRRQTMDQGTCVVLVDKSGERSFVSHHGAERQIDAAELDALAIGNDDWLLLTGYSVLKPQSARAFLPWLLQLAPGPHFVFDPGPIVAEIPAEALGVVLSRADWVSANRHEASFLSGLDDPALAAKSLSRNRKGAIVRAGADGCWLSLAGGTARHIPGFKVDAIDTNGAGDTHDGVFIAACCLGFGPFDAALMANGAAALSTTLHGPATSPGFIETQSFMQSRGHILAMPDATPIAHHDWEQQGATGRPQQGELK